MRTSLASAFAAIALGIGMAACYDARAERADLERQELERDLRLAAASAVSLASPSVDSASLGRENAPRATLTRAVGGKRKAPSVSVAEAPRTPDSAGGGSESVEAVVEHLPEAAINEPVATVPRSPPVLVPAADVGGYGTGGSGGVFGGVIIRGGGVDGDNCELHRRGRGSRGGRPVYDPAPTRTGGIFVGARDPGRPGVDRTAERPRDTGADRPRAGANGPISIASRGIGRVTPPGGARTPARDTGVEDAPESGRVRPRPSPSGE